MKNEPTKAFIFDMDGVIIDSEPVWERYEQVFLAELMGQKTYLKIKDQILGNSINAIYQIASRYGLEISKQEYLRIYDDYAKKVYAEAKLTPGIKEFIQKLIGMDLKLGLVSSSRQNWIDLVLEKLKVSKQFEFVISLNDAENMQPKPSPIGYLRAMEVLGFPPSSTIILEDSSKGVQAAKASGAFTICLEENLPEGYRPVGADLYIESITALSNQAKELLRL